jgi:hypothetical protein
MKKLFAAAVGLMVTASAWGAASGPLALAPRTNSAVFHDTNIAVIIVIPGTSNTWAVPWGFIRSNLTMIPSNSLYAALQAWTNLPNVNVTEGMTGRVITATSSRTTGTSTAGVLQATSANIAEGSTSRTATAASSTLGPAGAVNLLTAKDPTGLRTFTVESNVNVKMESDATFKHGIWRINGFDDGWRIWNDDNDTTNIVVETDGTVRFPGSVSTPSATVGTLSSGTNNVGVLYLSNVLFAAASVRALEGDVSNIYIQTNRQSANTTVVLTNTSVGQVIRAKFVGAASGGSNYDLIFVVPPGDLLTVNGAAPAVTSTQTSSNGYDFELSVIKDSFLSTNVWDLRYVRGIK